MTKKVKKTRPKIPPRADEVWSYARAVHEKTSTEDIETHALFACRSMKDDLPRLFRTLCLIYGNSGRCPTMLHFDIEVDGMLYILTGEKIMKLKAGTITTTSNWGPG